MLTKKKVSLPLPDDVVCENKISTSVNELIKIENEDIIKDIAGNIDTDAISDQLSSIATSGLSNALSNFGGFG